MKYQIATSNQLSKGYFELIEILYGQSEASNQYLNDTIKGVNAFASKQDQPIFFQAFQNDIFIGQIGLMANNDHEAFFGFFECTQKEALAELWSHLLIQARQLGIKKLFGPVNGSTWHPYRFVVKSGDEPFFPSEPISQTQYHQWFTDLNPTQVIEYHSAYRTNFTTIMQATQSSYNKACEQNIVIATEMISELNIKHLYQLATLVFSSNPGYTPLQFNNFIELYHNDRMNEKKSVLYTARINGELIGFCLNYEYKNNVIMKTIVVLPQWQQKGIGNALVYKIHDDAIKKGIGKVIYALIRKDNQVKHFPTDHIVVFREYSAFVFHI